MHAGDEYTCLDCGKVSIPAARLPFMTEIECLDCYDKKIKGNRLAEITQIVDALGCVIQGTTHEARDILRASLEIYSAEYPTAYQFIHADNPFLSQLLCVMAAETHANITRPDDAA